MGIGAFCEKNNANERILHFLLTNFMRGKMLSFIQSLEVVIYTQIYVYAIVQQNRTVESLLVITQIKLTLLIILPFITVLKNSHLELLESNQVP